MDWRLLPIAASLAASTALPTAAWEARIDRVCELTHATEGAEWRVTYDPAIPEYEITIRLATGTWPDAPVFAIRFEGGAALTISTARHVLSADGRSLSVTDSGFCNVLAGLEGNSRAVAEAGARATSAMLDGPRPAAPAVAEFRACVEGGLL